MTTHQEVCHAWAHQTGRQRKGFNIYYEGATLYSYGSHFPVARLVYVAGVVLFTTSSRSVSTAKHKRHARLAVSHLAIIDSSDPVSDDRGADFDAAINRASDAVNRSARARTRGYFFIRVALDEIAMANRISVLFGLGRQTVTIESLGVTVADIEARAESARQAEAVRLAEHERRRFERQEAMREAWLAGDNNGFYGVDDNGGALLRVNGDVLQTSQGASAPLAHAVRAFRFIKLVRERGTAWAANGHSLRVGHYAATSIDASGALRIGCHLIHWPEIERVAALLGVDSAAPSDEALTLTHSAA